MSKLPPTRVEPRRRAATCSNCRLHAARLDDAQKARYKPPLGAMFRIRLGSGGTVAVCPRCWKGATDNNGSPCSLVDLGIYTQRQARKLVHRGA